MAEVASSACEAELAMAGVIAGVVLFAVAGAGGGEELSVDTGTTETPVFEVLGPTVGEVSEAVGPVDGEMGEMVVGPVLGLESEVGLGVTDGTIELTLGAEEGTKDETLETTLETML